MNVQLDLEKIKKKANEFSSQNDRIAGIVQLIICFVGFAAVLGGEFKRKRKKN